MYARKLMLAVMAVVACSALVACGGAQSRKTRHMSRGQEYMQAGNFDKARVEFRNALQIEPNDAQARFLHGQSLERLGNLREAAGMYQAAIDVNTDHAAARANLARMFVFAGAPERALEFVEPGLVKYPDDPDLLTSRAAARMQLKDLPAATEDARRALVLDPANENAAALLASIYRQEGRAGDAISLIRGALERSPKSTDLRQVLATLYSGSGDAAHAEEQLRAIVALKPEELQNRYQLAIFLMREKRVDDAERVMSEAVTAVPDDAAPKLALVEFLAAQRSRDAAEKRLRQFIAADRDNGELLLGLAGLQERQGAEEEAIKTLKSIVAERKLAPEGLTARNRIAAIHLQHRRFDEALVWLREVLDENPRDNDALLLRGNVALERQQPDAAIADLRAVLRDQPGATGIMRTLARAHLANGESALAEENLRAAMTVAPTDTSIAIELGQLLNGSGRSAQAVTLLENAVRRMPQDVAARSALVQAYVTNKDLQAAAVAVADLKTLAPQVATGYYLAGLIAQAGGNLADSEREFEAALERSPDTADALAALARSMLATGRADEAEARVRKTLAQSPANAAAHNLLGELLLARREMAGASAEFSAALAATPRWWLPYRNLALAQLGAKDTAAAVETLERGLKATGHEPALATELAALQERLGKIDAAIKVYDELHRRVPRSELAANNLAMLLVTYRKDAASLDRARDLTAAFVNSNNPALLDTHAWVRVRRGEYAAALPLLERAVRQAPDSRVIRYHLATAQLESGQRTQAAENLERALSTPGDFAGAASARAMLAELRR
jgi:tetratricopeptide (TPR) repeat protein